MKASDKKRIENKPGFICFAKTETGRNDFRYVIYKYVWNGEWKQFNTEYCAFI